MLWLELSKDFEHGGGSWGFTYMLWAPTRKQSHNGRLGARSAYWENILKVRAGDVVLHLREEKTTAFVGFSTVETDGEETADRPPRPGEWGYSTHFYRAVLKDFRRFSSPLDVRALFASQDRALRQYFEKNKEQPDNTKRTLFYVIQAERLQCQFGAYLSEVDEELEAILLLPELFVPHGSKSPGVIEIATREQIVQMRARVGQQAFAERIRANYHMQCCFPSCPIAEEHFLIGSHIARWADVPELRGNPGNGLCLCLLHDKAFEMGLFTVDGDFRILVNKNNETVKSSQWCETGLLPFDGLPINRGDVLPLEAALQHHWRRIGIISSEI